MSTLRIGLFEEFKGDGDRTLLLWSDEEDSFEALLATLGAAADTRKLVTLTDLPWVKGVGGARLEVNVGEPGSVREAPLPNGGLTIRLQLSPDQLREFTDKVESFSLLGRTGHHYFDPPGAQLQIIISKGEYSADLRPDA